jgi:phospholipid/cholesterol/gamma-HCH transport system ATP-binding protein
MTETSETHILVEDLRIGWGSVVLMDHVGFAIKRGATFALLGGSGCGKSTLMRHLIGLERPQSCRIHIEGLGVPHEFEGVPPFGVMFQSGALFGSMTLAENCALPLTTWTAVEGDTAQELIRAKLDLVDLGPFADHLPGEISGGMKKRAGIARALMLEPELLFLDEPSAGLDPISAVELDDLIKSLCANLDITVVAVTHELPSIFRIAEECIVSTRPPRASWPKAIPAFCGIRATSPSCTISSTESRLRHRRTRGADTWQRRKTTLGWDCSWSYRPW